MRTKELKQVQDNKEREVEKWKQEMEVMREKGRQNRTKIEEEFEKGMAVKREKEESQRQSTSREWSECQEKLKW